MFPFVLSWNWAFLLYSTLATLSNVFGKLETIQSEFSLLLVKGGRFDFNGMVVQSNLTEYDLKKKYKAGLSYIPSILEVPSFFSPEKAYYFKLAHPNIPSIPFSLYSHGMKFNGTTFPAALRKDKEIELMFMKHLNPIEINGITKPAVFWMQAQIKFDSFDDFLALSMSTPEIQKPNADQKKAISIHNQMFTDSYVMEQNFLATLFSAAPLNALSGLKKLKDHTVFKNDFGMGHQEAIIYLTTGLYYVLDTESISHVQPHTPNTNDAKYAVGSKVLLRKQEDGVLVPEAIKLTMLQDREKKAKPLVKVFLKEKCTDSAWRLAILAARSSVTQWGIIVAHFVPLHITVATFQQGVYNTFSSHHKLREFLSPFLLYTMQFDNMALQNLAQLRGLPYLNDAPECENFLGVFKAWDKQYKEIPFSGQLPSHILSNNRIFVEDFTKVKPWDLLPNARHAIQLEQMTKKFSETVVHALYHKDTDVKHDIQLQDFFKKAKSTKHLNMKNLLNQNQDHISKKHELVKILNTYFYTVVQHGFSRIDDFSEGGKTVPFVIPAFNVMDFMFRDPATYHFSDKEILKHMPPSRFAGELIGLYYFFTATTPQDNLGDIDDIYTGSDSVNVTLKKAVQQLSEDIKMVIKEEMDDDKLDIDIESNLRRIPRNCES